MTHPEFQRFLNAIKETACEYGLGEHRQNGYGKVSLDIDIMRNDVTGSITIHQRPPIPKSLSEVKELIAQMAEESKTQIA